MASRDGDPRRSTGERFRARVLVVGGGIAGMEAAIALRELAGDLADVTICSPREDFVYRPFAVAEPYGASHGTRHRLWQLTERCDASFHLGSIGFVDDGARRARTDDGGEIDYDYMVLACGSRLLAGVSGAVTFWGGADDARVQGVVRDLRERRVRRVVFTMPGGGTWALPMYELALLARSELSRAGVGDAGLAIVTPEDAPLHLFGPVASARVGELLAQREIEVIVGATPVEYDGGRLSVSPSATVEADAVISLPRIEGRRIGGIPHDPDGFVAVDKRGRVNGLRHVMAAGDVTSFPVKQGGIATQQADLAAEAIAAELGRALTVHPFDPILRGVLWNGADPLYLFNHLAGGHGETSSASDQPPWQGGDVDKIVGRYLTPFLRSCLPQRSLSTEYQTRSATLASSSPARARRR
jgi:sulfide:quinone oxidoreductase